MPRIEGLLNSPHKDIIEEQKAKIAGADLDSSLPARRHGVVPLGSPVVKRLALALVSQEVVRMRFTSDALHACLLGGWTSALMFRRQLMSVLFTSSLDSSNPKVLPLPRSVAQELLLLSIFAPLMCSDLSAVLGDQLTLPMPKEPSSLLPSLLSFQGTCGGWVQRKEAMLAF